MADDKGGLLGVLDGVGHGGRFTGASDAEQGLAVKAFIDALGELFDGGGLVAGGLEWSF